MKNHILTTSTTGHAETGTVGDLFGLLASHIDAVALTIRLRLHPRTLRIIVAQTNTYEWTSGNKFRGKRNHLFKMCQW